MDTALGSFTTATFAKVPEIQPGSSDSQPGKPRSERFVPIEPKQFEELGINRDSLEALILKNLLYRGNVAGRDIADSLHLPRPIVVEALETLRAELLITIKSSAGIEDYVFQLTEAGHERANRLTQRCTYTGVAPVPLEDYIGAMQRQSLRQSKLSFDSLRQTFDELRLSDSLLSQLGQAVNDGRGLFLYGPPGNGKTSVSELVVGAFGEFLWIPHTITIDGELVRLYDPRSHQAVESAELESANYDRRWILIHRPTIIVGGELTMEQLDLQFNDQTGICEAPVQLRANGGALVIDDFGRQRMPTSELLNRMIVPMEKHHDYINLPSGRQVTVPFDMLTVFSTNLKPQDLVDEAFLRRIPYKIEVQGPSQAEFTELFLELAQQNGLSCEPTAIEHLLEQHYKPVERPLRYCHPRDLIRQIRNYCEFHGQAPAVNEKTVSEAVRNYFSQL